MVVNQQRARRLDRILQAVSFEKPDRVPVILEYAGFAASATQTKMSDFARSPSFATEIMIRAYQAIGGGDAVNYGSFSPYNLCYIYGAKVKVPGIELSENEIWQVVETELMTVRDYDRILEMGWPDFFQNFLTNRILNDADEELLRLSSVPVDVVEEWSKIGVPVLSGGTVTTPFELLCGARSLEKFFMDLIEIPKKVEKVMDVIAPHLTKFQCERTRQSGYPAIWIGGWRSAPFMMSSEMWQRFVWPYFKGLICEIIESGLIAVLHLDSNWDREIERLKELPPKKAIVALDGETDIIRAKEILGGHLCVMGDVPPALLAFGTPEEVFDYCRKLIRELGPDGFILQSGCDIPSNAKLENVQAMVRAGLK